MMRHLRPAALLVPLLAVSCGDPTEPSVPQRVVEVVAGANHTCAIGDNGHAYCWGDDRLGQLGARMEESCRGDHCRRPVPLEGDLVVTAIALGEAHTCGIAGRQLYCWGTARFGRLGDDSLVNEICRETPAFKCAVVPRRAAIGLPFTAVTAHQMHSCGLDATGRAFCWGRNEGMQLGTGDTGERPLPVAVPTDLRFETITTGRAHTCGLIAPNAYCWGYGGAGRLGTGNAVDRPAPTLVGDGTVVRLWREVDAGEGHTCGIETNGVVSCWGLGDQGQLGLEDRRSQLRPVPVDVPGRAAQVSAGGFHSCAVNQNGSLYCWGANDRGQIGIGTSDRQLAPVRVPIPMRVRHVSAGFAHTCAIIDDGSLLCWGANDFGQLGDGTRLDRSTPVRVDF